LGGKKEKSSHRGPEEEPEFTATKIERGKGDFVTLDL